MTATLEQLDPTTLTIAGNIRLDARLGPGFIASIKSRGILQPVLAHREDGRVVVDHGERRVLAALELGLNGIPVVVDDEKPAGGDGYRLVDQLIENEHREPLTNRELVAAVKQAALFNLDLEIVSRRAALPFADVLNAATIAESKAALEHVDEVTLEDAAALAEFDDNPEDVKRLLQRIEWGQGTAHEAERIRADRAEKAEIAARAAELTEQGITVIAKPDWEDKKTAPLDDLRNGKRKIDPAKHAADCAGHVAWIQPSWAGREREIVAVPGCTGWAQHGHVSTRGSAGGKVAAADMTDEQREQARRERRHVIESNKAWNAATTVRRRWLTEFAGRTSTPSGAEQIIARAMLEGWSQDVWAGDAFTLLDSTKESMLAALTRASAKRALQMTLAIALAHWEASTSDDTWRSEYQHDRAILVLQTISQWGYELSEIEQRIIDGNAAEASLMATTDAPVEVDHCVICGHPAHDSYACDRCRADEAREAAEAGPDSWEWLGTSR